MDKLSEAEALVGIAMCAAYSDGAMGAEEDEELTDQLASCRALEAMDEASMREAMVKADAMLRKAGEATFLDEAAASLRPELRPTAFFLGADVALADGEYAQEERTFIERLRKGLGLDPALAQRIVEVVLIWNRA